MAESTGYDMLLGNDGSDINIERDCFNDATGLLVVSIQAC